MKYIVNILLFRNCCKSCLPIKIRVNKGIVPILIALSFAFTIIAQDQSTGKAPGKQDQPIKSIGEHPEGTDLGYGSDGIGGMWYSVGVPSGTLTSLGVSSGLHQGGDFDATGTFYATLSPATLITVDPATGVETTVAPITGVTPTQIITGMAWCDATGTMFLGTTDVVATSELYSLNLATGAATFIGVIGQSGLIAIACDCDGNMYSVDFVSDDLWSIDTGTGAGTAIGPTGFDLNFAQDADFNPNDGIMYLAAYNLTTGSGQFRSVDLGTGATTLLLDWGFLEITDFGIMGSCGPPCTIGLPTNPDPPDGSTGWKLGNIDLSWTNGSGVTSIEVWFDGSQVYSGAPISIITVNAPDFSTTYSWRVNGLNDTCTTFGPTWKFTTMDDPSFDCLFMDDFEDGVLTNWTVTNDGGTCDWLALDIGTNNYSLPPTAGGFLLSADSDLCGSGTTLLSTATMVNSVDASCYSSVWVEFDNDWRTIDVKDEAHVQFSLDGGGTWNTVVSWIGIDQRDTYESHFVPASFQPDIRFRFRVIQPGWDWWWVIDNFAVYGSCYSCPQAPSDLIAIAEYNTGSTVLLNWTDNSFNEETFLIERKLGDAGSTNEFSIVATVPENTTTYIDNTVADTTIYTYRVRARTLVGFFSCYSNLAEVMTLIPVELTSFVGKEIDGNVQLNWSTATETNNLGFEIERTPLGPPFGKEGKKGEWEKIGFVQGHGTTTKPQSYSFKDESIQSGTYQYRLKQIDYDGSYEYSNIIEVEVGIPTEFSLEQNYPNPFNPTTRIRFSLPQQKNPLLGGDERGGSLPVQLIIYDILGNEVATLINEEKKAGIYEVEFNTNNLSAVRNGITSGIYFYRLTAGNFSDTKKFVLVK